MRRRVLAGLLKARRGPLKHHILSRADVEALALQTYRYRNHINDPGSYWVTGQRAANNLGVNVSRARALTYKGLIPSGRHADGTLMYRREQLMTVANAREARWR